MPFGGLISGLGSVLGAGISAGAASSAADAQAASAQAATQNQRQEFDSIQALLSPYYQQGTNALSTLTGLLGTGAGGFGNFGDTPLTTPIQQLLQQAGIGNNGYAPTPQSANGGAAPPSYNLPTPTMGNIAPWMPPIDFQLQQGSNAIANAGSGVRGAVSGNMLRDLQTFGQGLAQQDWQQGFNNYQGNYQNQYNAGNQNYWNLYNAASGGYNTNAQTTQNYQQQIYNFLNGISGGGQNAAASLGGFGSNMANQVGNYLTQGGNAVAAGTVGTANAITGGINSLTQPNLGSALGGTSNLSSALNYIFGGGNNAGVGASYGSVYQGDPGGWNYGGG